MNRVELFGWNPTDFEQSHVATRQLSNYRLRRRLILPACLVFSTETLPCARLKILPISCSFCSEQLARPCPCRCCTCVLKLLTCNTHISDTLSTTCCNLSCACVHCAPDLLSSCNTPSNRWCLSDQPSTLAEAVPMWQICGNVPLLNRLPLLLTSAVETEAGHVLPSKTATRASKPARLTYIFTGDCGVSCGASWSPASPFRVEAVSLQWLRLHFHTSRHRDPLYRLQGLSRLTWLV